MVVNIGHLFRKRTVRNLAGQVVDMTDEANGGVIVAKGYVVNQERFDEIKRMEEDKKRAATAAVQVAAPESVVEERQTAPGKMQELEKKVQGMETNIAAILELLQKK